MHLLDFSTPFFHWSVSFYLPAIIIAYFSIQLRSQSIIYKKKISHRQSPPGDFRCQFAKYKIKLQFPPSYTYRVWIEAVCGNMTGHGNERVCWGNDFGKRACSLRVVKFRQIATQVI
jgi:hypothetical protein